MSAKVAPLDTEGRFVALERHRLALCDQLDGLADDDWEVGSLCAGWRVRDVLGHLVTVQDIPTWRFLIGVFGLKGFHRRADRFARDYGRRPPGQLVARYREVAGSRRTPPFGGPIAPLTDVVVHALDIQRPLGLAPIEDEAAVVTVVDALCGGLAGFTPKKLVRGLRFEATDLDWSTGDGPVVRGPGADLALAVTGRPIDDGSALDGDGVAVLGDRLTG